MEAIVDGISTKDATVDYILVVNEEKLKGEGEAYPYLCR